MRWNNRAALVSGAVSDRLGVKKTLLLAPRSPSTALSHRRPLIALSPSSCSPSHRPPLIAPLAFLAFATAARLTRSASLEGSSSSSTALPSPPPASPGPPSADSPSALRSHHASLPW